MEHERTHRHMESPYIPMPLCFFVRSFTLFLLSQRDWERVREMEHLWSSVYSIWACPNTHSKTSWIVLAEMSLARGSLPQFLLFYYSDLTMCASPSFLFSHLIYDCQGAAPETHRPSTMSPPCLLMKRLFWLLLEADMKLMFSLHNQTR